MMPILNDATSILKYAREHEWLPGAPLIAFRFDDVPPRGHTTYRDMFAAWRADINATARGERANLYAFFYSISYVLAVNTLRNGNIDGQAVAPEELNVRWLQQISLPYPTDPNHYNYLDDGLWTNFRHRVPRNAHGRMFLTGIGRESGYYAVTYAEVLRDQVLRHFGSSWERIAREVSAVEEATQQQPWIPATKIPIDQNTRDYGAIARFYARIAELSMEGRLDSDGVADVAGHLEVSEATAIQVIQVFAAAGENGHRAATSHALILRMTATGDVGLSLPREAVLSVPNDAIDKDIYYAFIRNGAYGAATSHVYRSQARIWLHDGGQGLFEPVAPGQNLQAMRSYRTVTGEGSSVVRENVTPDLLQQPVVLFHEQGRPVNLRVSKLIPGQTYRLFRTGEWSDGMVICKQDANGYAELGLDVTEFEVGNDWDAVWVRDGLGNDLQEFPCRRNAAIAFSFGEVNLACFVPGRRCFTAPPVISAASVNAVEGISICQNGNIVFETQDDGPFDLPFELAEVWNNADGLYGQFEMTIRLGDRRGFGRFSLLPRDFSHDLDQDLAVVQAGEIMFESASLLPEGAVSIEIAPDQTQVDTVLEFQTGWQTQIRYPVRRSGAYIDRPDHAAVALGQNAAVAPYVNLDDVIDDGALVIAHTPGRLASIRVSNAAGREEDHAAGEPIRECVGECFQRQGYVRYPFSQLTAHTGVGYHRLVRCDQLTVRSRLPGTPDTPLGVARLTQYSALFPNWEIIDGELRLRHRISAMRMERAPFIVLLPIGEQGCESVFALADEKERELPDWCTRCLANVQVEREDGAGDWVHFRLPGWPEAVGDQSPAYIGFILGGHADRPQRLSAGFFVGGYAEVEAAEWTRAFLERDQNTIGRLLGQDNDFTRAYINGIYTNACRMDAFHFLNSFHSLKQDEPSGYVFRAAWYWFGLLFRSWIIENGNGQLDAGSIDRLSLLKALWDEELCGYSEAKSQAEALAIDGAVAHGLIQIPPKVSWPICLRWLLTDQNVGGAAEVVALLHLLRDQVAEQLLGERLEAWEDELVRRASTYADNGEPLAWIAVRNEYPWGIHDLPDVPNLQVVPNDFDRYLSRLGYRLHRWRMAPAIGLESNRLRDELQWLVRFMPAMKSLAVLLSLVYAWHDNEFQQLRG